MLGWKKLAGPCTSSRRGRRGGEPFLSSADVKIAFKSFEDALVSFYLPDKPQSLDVQLLVREEGKKKPEGWKKGEEAGVPQEIQPSYPLSRGSIRGENSVIVFLYGCHRVV